MNSLKALNEIYNGLTGHCKSSYLKDQPNNELEKTCKKYEDFYEQIKKGLQELEAYEKLEREIGCPLEVRCKVVKDSTVCTAGGESWYVKEIYKGSFLVVNYYYKKEQKLMFWDDYLDEWYLPEDWDIWKEKQDRSE